jgi:hypothetical protein
LCFPGERLIQRIRPVGSINPQHPAIDEHSAAADIQDRHRQVKARYHHASADRRRNAVELDELVQAWIAPFG